MIVTGLDTETTGLKCDKGDRIIEICLISYDLDSGKRISSYSQRINPEGRTIDPKAESVHGISAKDLVGKPKWKEIAGDVDGVLRQSNLLIAHNLDFDAPFLASEQEAAGFTIPSGLDALCTMELGRWATPDGKLPKLSELCWSLHVDYDPSKAHSAEYDVEVMMECFFKGRRLGFFNHNLGT
jgi:DNA polymerase III subunit epsilon